MTLPLGTRVGPYEILAPVGAGGMGEVYRARDARLDRDVAIKILPAAFASDVERLARFEREAKTLAALNHPNIAQIYGIEQNSLVMELVDGETLAARLERGAIDLDEALPIARQIAGALEAAHERGIIHRDLKPANVMLTAAGDVKVLDFGLAKAFEGGSSSADLMNSPTVTSPATQAGVILGTASYMSPEQAKGRPVDRRTDVWSFGVLLLEMLTGERAFPGASVTEVLAAVMRDAPPFDRLPASTPASIHRLLRRALEKDRAKRLDSMAAVRIEIDDALSGAGEASAVAAPRGRALRRALPWAVAVLALATAGVTRYDTWRATPEAPAVTRLNISIGIDGFVAARFGSAFAISPNGRVIVVALDNSRGKRELYVRHLDRLEATPLPGTEGGREPFFSPDGEWIGFFADGRLKKVALTGGAAIDLASAQVSRGGTWGEDGYIYYTPTAGPGTLLLRIPATGGQPTQVGPLFAGHVTQRFAQVLPGAKAVLYTGHSSVDTFEDASLMVQTLDGRPPREVMKGGFGWQYVPSGHVLYVHSGTLFSVRFDLDTLQVTGQPVPVVEGLIVSPNTGGAQFAVSSAGTLVYARGAEVTAGERIEWLDLSGKVTPLTSAEENFQSLSLSPDGTKLAIQLMENRLEPEIWVHDLTRDTRVRLTVNQVPDLRPMWTPDSKRLIFGSALGGPPNLYWQVADGSAPAERLSTSAASQFPGSWHPDQKRFVFVEGDTSFGLRLLTLPEKSVVTIADGPGNEGHPRISPDGRWLAYTSDESGQFEVYVRPFPDGPARWPVSGVGGAWPLWSPTSNILYFATMGGELMEVPFRIVSGAFQPGRMKPMANSTMFIRSAGFPWDIHPDGKRFIGAVMEQRAETAREEIILVTGFLDSLKARAK